MPHQQHPSHFFHSRQQLLLQLLLLFMINKTIFGNPAASPEITSQSVTKANNNLNSQQHQSYRLNNQETHLNSLNAYATNYDTIVQNGQQQQEQQQNNFKPSYKLPEMETNFTPIQTANSPELPVGGTPVLMQYISQPLQEGGVQYLQLIPTRPLIVPISPYANGNSGSNGAQPPSSYYPTLQTTNTVEYQLHGPGMLKTLPPNIAPPAASQPSLANLPMSLPYGLQTYANSLQPYRNNYRYHRDIKDKHLPHSLSLNLNEYIPAQGGSIQRPAYNIRGRP